MEKQANVILANEVNTSSVSDRQGLLIIALSTRILKVKTHGSRFYSGHQNVLALVRIIKHLSRKTFTSLEYEEQDQGVDWKACNENVISN